MLKLPKSIIFFFTITLLFITSLKITSAKETVNNSQPYKIIKNEVTDGSKTKKLLIISSIEPKESEFHHLYAQKINSLSEIIKSHWGVEVEIIDVSDYQQGDINNFDVLFFIEEYGRLIPYVLFRDILHSVDQQIIWSGFGSEELIASLLRKYLRFTPKPPEFVNLEYKSVNFDLNDFSYMARFELPENSEKVKVLASAVNKKGERKPVILDINDRFLILPFELPFTYSVNNYSLVFLDVLHHALGHHQEEKKVLLRLEDIDTYTYRKTDKLADVYAYLEEHDIPFHIALIARYINPEKKLDLKIGDRFSFKKLLTKMVNEGLGTIVQHGYTHQHDSGVSAYDYEFWDGETGKPLSYDSEEYITERILAAQEIMKASSLPIPDIWETPHYTLSKLDETVVNSFYPLRYGDLQGFGKLPFTTEFNSIIYFPENLGYVDDNLDIKRIEDLLSQLSVFEDPVASFFWHPWRDLSELKHLVKLMQEVQYKFVSVYDLVDYTSKETVISPLETIANSAIIERSGYPALVTFRNNKNLLLKYIITEFWMGTCFILFSFGGFLYLRNIYRLRKNFGQIKNTKITIDKLKILARRLDRKLPIIAIFVPARMEGYVIENTLRRLAKLDYPKEKLRVFVICDARDMDEKPEILTKDVVRRLSTKLNRKYRCRFLHCLEVPKWYSGKFGSYEKTFKNSTKGRALNWGLQKVYKSKQWQSIDMIGVLDADGRFDKNVIKEVAFKRLKYKSPLLQGPVFQVSNFGQVSFIGVAAGLELAIHHMTKVAHRLINEGGRPQFLAGTNYFVDKNLMVSVGGWNDDVLVEDAELALRSYIERGAVAQWLSWPEVEQTPPSFSVYRRQRDRWVRGHLDLIPYIRKSAIPLRDKLRFLGEIYTNMFRVFIDLGVPVVGWTLMLSGVLLDLGPLLQIFSLFLLIMSVLIWDFYGLMYRKLKSYGYINVKPTTPSSTSSALSSASGSTTLYSFFLPFSKLNGNVTVLNSGILLSFKLILFIPYFIVAQSVPRITGSLKYLFKIGQGTWYKTERTKEAIIE